MEDSLKSGARSGAPDFTPEQKEFLELLGPPPLVPGDDGNRYQRFLAAIVAEVKPTDILECIWVRDVIDLQWEILRYRKAKAQLFESAIAHAADNALDGGFPSDIIQGNPSSLQAVGFTINDLRRLDLMVMSKEARRDNAYREIEHRREVFARKLRRAVDRLESVNADRSDDASLGAKCAA
jgi:hypothetical protein